MHAYRTHTCAELRAADVGSTVRLSGWIHRKRDHGGVLFVDLRDHYGLTQLVCRAGSGALKTLDSLRVESVVTIDGKVVDREGGAVNAKLDTGDIEVVVEAVEVQSSAAELPMPVAGEADYPEETRLRYRYLDLRRERLVVTRKPDVSDERMQLGKCEDALVGHGEEEKSVEVDEGVLLRRALARKVAQFPLAQGVASELPGLARGGVKDLFLLFLLLGRPCGRHGWCGGGEKRAWDS